MKIFAKYYFIDNNYSHDTYFIPLIQALRYKYDNISNKASIIKTYEWNICKLLFRCHLQKDIPYKDSMAEEILDLLNYEYMDNPSVYIEKK